ncbi:MAG TPA: AbrB/MazE/SpoVT family DNA-binding domain-containing protein [Caulobacteraceae bacterium]|nr:AbrB/MazE/SpoVT family DNA-binding domain-containing protein [Caulobacteraceae bacterium]
MSAAPKLVTRVSTKGQVILPKSVRENRKWTTGTQLVVEETDEGVLLRPAALFPPTTIDDVCGSLKWSGPPITLEQMDEAISAEVRERHARGRY